VWVARTYLTLQIVYFMFKNTKITKNSIPPEAD
jgi:hypothetical protein